MLEKPCDNFLKKKKEEKEQNLDIIKMLKKRGVKSMKIKFTFDSDDD